MDDPHDDTDVPSGTTDGAQMERTLPPVLCRELLVAWCGVLPLWAVLVGYHSLSAEGVSVRWGSLKG